MHKALREGLPVLANIESYFQLGLLGFWSLNEILIELDWIDIEDSPAMHKRKGKKKNIVFWMCELLWFGAMLRREKF